MDIGLEFAPKHNTPSLFLTNFVEAHNDGQMVLSLDTVFLCGLW